MDWIIYLIGFKNNPLEYVQRGLKKKLLLLNNMVH